MTHEPVISVAFDPETHEYQMGRVRIPSVTQIIREVLGSRWSAGDWYLQRGRAVHACAAFLAREEDFRHDPAIDGQVTALRRFFREVQPEVVMSEARMASSLYRYAGTPDLIAVIGGKRMVVDFKASCDDRLPFQLGGYSRLCSEAGTPCSYGCGVEIRENGTYSMTSPIKLRNYESEFLAMRTVFAIRERLGLVEGEGQ